MDLKYRGSSYKKATHILERSDKQFIGQYRGQDCYRAIYDLKSIPQANPRLKYRGIEYGGVQPEATPVTHEMTDNAFRIELPHQKKPVRSSRHHVLSELDKVHNDYLLKNLELRLSSAKQRGDQRLVNMLEQEKDQLA